MATVKSSGTPLGIGFDIGQPCCIGKVWDSWICFNKTELRLLSDEQVKVHFTNLKHIASQAKPRQAVKEVLGRLLDSPTGRIIPFPKVETFPLPAGWPETYLNRRVLCSRAFPAVPKPDDWTWADWLGLEAIYVEQAIAEAITARKLWDWRDDTLQHEYHESGDCFLEARMLFPDAKPAQMAGLMLIFGGWAHIRTIHAVDGFTKEPEYDDEFDREIIQLGLPKEKPRAA